LQVGSEILDIPRIAPFFLETALIRYQLGNHLGSASLELDQNGDLISYEEYHPYGTTAFQAGRSAAEVSLKRYRYTAKERDEESGFNYHGARYYAPWLARWTSADPIGIQDGVNVFAYVSGNPVKLIDPTGNSAAGEAKFISMYEHAASLPPERREEFYKTQGQIALLSLSATAFLATGTVAGPAAALKLGLAGALFGGIADLGTQLARQADANSKGEPVPDIDYREAALSAWIGAGLGPLALSPAPVLCAVGGIGGGLALNQAVNAYQEENYYTAAANLALALPPLAIAGSRGYGAYQRFTNTSINQARAGRTHFSELEWLLLDETGSISGRGNRPSIIQNALGKASLEPNTGMDARLTRISV
jgi:RHS repeat-associated protein